MQRFDDERTRQIYEMRFADGVPEHVSVAAHETMHPLVAARTHQDVGVLGTIIRLHSPPERYGLHISGKWHVTFAWSADFGAYAIKLERR
jgi:plasmid maintenance system killer protein